MRCSTPISFGLKVVILGEREGICGWDSKRQRTASMIDGSGVAIDNRMRRAEKQNQWPIRRLLEGAESSAFVAGPATGSRTVGAIATTLGMAPPQATFAQDDELFF
jgi:hypothetical protein